MKGSEKYHEIYKKKFCCGQVGHSRSIPFNFSRRSDIMKQQRRPVYLQFACCRSCATASISRSDAPIVQYAVDLGMCDDEIWNAAGSGWDGWRMPLPYRTAAVRTCTRCAQQPEWIKGQSTLFSYHDHVEHHHQLNWILILTQHQHDIDNHPPRWLQTRTESDCPSSRK